MAETAARTGCSADELAHALVENLRYVLAFRPLVDSLLDRDEYMLLADPSYLECQQRVSEAYLDPARWTRMSILNVARVG